MTETRDRVGVALWTILAGSTAGAAACSAALLVWRLAMLSVDALPFILLGSLSVAGLAGWFLSRGVGDSWRRAVTVAICVLGTALLLLGTIVVDLTGQALGIAAYGATLTAVSVLAGIRARR